MAKFKKFKAPAVVSLNVKKAADAGVITDVSDKLQFGKPLHLGEIKTIKKYFDAHDERDNNWMGWGGTEGRDWVERVLSGTTMRKVSLIDINPGKLSDMPSDEVRLAWLRLNQWYENAKKNKRPIEDYVNAARWVMAEFERRKFDIDQNLPLAAEANKLNKQLIEARYNNLPYEMVVVNDFVSVVGSTATGKANPDDLDILIRAAQDYESNLLIKAENAWLQVRKALNPNKLIDLQFIYNAQGSHDDYIPMYDLVLRRREIPETKIVKAQPTLQDVHVPSTMGGKTCIDLGCGKKKKPGYFGIDISKEACPDLVYDLSKGIPYDDNSVDAVHASHFLEHCAEPNQIMSEIHRVLKPGGVFEFEVPSTQGEGAFAHPDHKSFWNKSSFAFWTNPDYVEDRPKFDLLEIEEVGEGDRINVIGKMCKPDNLEKALAPFKPFQPPKPELAGMTEIFTTKELWEWAKDRLPVDVEPKWNGFRVIAERSGDRLRLWTEGKPGDNMLDKLPQLKAELEKIPGSWVMDADLAIEKDGKRLPRPDLMKLNRGKIEFAEGENPVLTVFDMPYHNEDLSTKSFKERRAHLESMKFFNDIIKLSPVKWIDNEKELKAAIKWGLGHDRSEGVVAKEGGSAYPKGSTNVWSKLKRAVELKVLVMDTKPVKGGGHIYLGGLILSQGESWKNVTDGHVKLGWTFTSDVSASKGDIITTSVLELVPDEESNELTWLGATVMDVDKSRKTPYTTGQSIDIAKRGGVLQKMLEFNSMESCFFCDQEPEKVIIWGGGVKTLYICSDHMAEGIEHTIHVNRDKVDQVLDINESKEYNVQTPSGISINVSISKKLGDEGDISRESVATQFWNDNWDKLYPHSGKGKFVYQHHWRGLTEKETKLSDKELMDTSHSVHGDLRFEAGKELWGFSAFIGTAAANKGGDKVITATDATKVRGSFKLAQPKAWLNVGVNKPYVSEPGGVGSTSQKYALFEALDHGTYQLGVRNRHFVEVFLNGDKIKGRYTIMSIPVEGGRAWILSKPKDQTPYAESHNLEDEIKRLKKEGHKKLLWAKPGESPKVIDLMAKVEKDEGDLEVALVKSLDEEKHLVMGIALEPDKVDAHNDTISADEIEKAAHAYLDKSRVVGDQHRSKADAKVVESYIAPVDMKVNGEVIRKGSWVVVVKVLSEKMWKDVKAGKYTGFSIGGYGKRIAAH